MSGNRDRKATVFAGLSLVILFGGSFASLLLPGNDQVLGVIAAVTGYVFCGRCALSRWHADDRVFEHPSWTGIRVLIAAVAIGALASTATAQQTIFNMPTADVLDRGRLYTEVDALWRSGSSGFSSETVRGVYGLGANLEGGINIGGLNTPGPSAPTATPNLKWKPWHWDRFAVTAGAYGLFFLRGSRDGHPAGLGYAHAAFRPLAGTRLTAGAWRATSGYAARDPTGGGLFGIEQSIVPHVIIAADWFTGPSSLGYLSPGLIVTAGSWTLYAAYSIGNSDRTPNAALLELGFLLP